MEDPYEIVITRKPAPESPPAFVCAACKNTIIPSSFRWHPQEKKPLCLSCIRHWGRGFGFNVTGVNRNDQRKIRTVAALISLIDWSVKNARYSR